MSKLLRLTNSDDGLWLHIKASTGLQAGFYIGQLTNHMSIADRAVIAALQDQEKPEPLTLNELQELASRTLPPPGVNHWFLPNFSEPIPKDGSSYIPLSHAQRIDFIHGMFGAIGELGEAVDPLKKNMFYGKPMTEEMWTNVREEIGDKLWYLVATFCRALGVSLEDLARENIRKLQIRYPEKYTEQAAIDRADKA